MESEISILTGESDREAKDIYEIYFYMGIVCTLCSMIWFILYFSLGLKKLHSLKIVINILFLDFLISLKYFITFSVYKMSGDNLKYSPYNERDFGFLEFNWKLEGFTSYILFIVIILWNFSWAYDIYYAIEHPNTPNNSRVFYYKIFSYFVGSLFALVVFYSNMEIFTDTKMFIWSMKYGEIYNIFINSFVFIVILINIFIEMKYARKISSFEVDENSKMIRKNINIHRLYSLFWALSSLSNFVFVFIDSFHMKFVHGVIVVSSPLVIWSTFMFALIIHIRRNSSKKYTLLTVEEENKLEKLNQKTSSDLIGTKTKKTLFDSFLILNMKSIDSDGAKFFMKPEDRAFDTLQWKKSPVTTKKFVCC